MIKGDSQDMQVEMRGQAAKGQEGGGGYDMQHGRVVDISV